jgi:hypothetical protein
MPGQGAGKRVGGAEVALVRVANFAAGGAADQPRGHPVFRTVTPGRLGWPPGLAAAGPPDAPLDFRETVTTCDGREDRVPDRGSPARRGRAGRADNGKGHLGDLPLRARRDKNLGRRGHIRLPWWLYLSRPVRPPGSEAVEGSDPWWRPGFRWTGRARGAGRSATRAARPRRGGRGRRARSGVSGFGCIAARFPGCGI